LGQPIIKIQYPFAVRRAETMGPALQGGDTSLKLADEGVSWIYPSEFEFA
jgi:hypothetical protein